MRVLSSFKIDLKLNKGFPVIWIVGKEPWPKMLYWTPIENKMLPSDQKNVKFDKTYLYILD